MLVLALDTTTKAGSAALSRDGHLLEVREGDAALTHAQRLPGDLFALLARHRLDLGDVDLFAVVTGPGSFTGLRIGIAAIQGLAFATGRPVAGVSTLDVLAIVAAGWRRSAGLDAGGLVGAVMDAQRGEVFSAFYHEAAWKGQTAAPEQTGEPPSSEMHVRLGTTAVGLVEAASVAAPQLAFARWAAVLQAGQRIVAAGDGLVRYAAEARQALGERLLAVDPLPPLAGTAALMGGELAAAGGAGAPHAVRPVYVRRPDAELARERKRQAP